MRQEKHWKVAEASGGDVTSVAEGKGDEMDDEQRQIQRWVAIVVVGIRRGGGGDGQEEGASVINSRSDGGGDQVTQQNVWYRRYTLK